ncbi:MAG TPA: serine/threonine-protein kinase [Polyangia bacterium]|nr:serine/threonine-protein kinase [Polyangia bacterium]
MAPAETARPAGAGEMPTTYGRFRLTGRIGIGGMAEVFRAVVKGPQGWERELVVKRILPQLSGNAEFTKMFIREAKISALLVHPNIVQTFEFGEAEGTYFIAMEGVDGVTLREALTKLRKGQRAMPFMVIADIAKQVCTGLDYAHTLTGPDGAPLEIVHQDVSPTNIMLAFNGTVKILDFGIARAASFAEEEAKKGLIKGKVAYLAPEQVNMQPFDHRIDLFALGVVMHEMMTGVRLFQAKNDVAKMRQLLAAPIPAPSSINAAVPRELDRIVMKALEVDPAQRYQSATAMANDLERTMIAARHSSRDLAKLLRGLFKEEGDEPLVVVDEVAPSAPIAAGPLTGSMSSVRSSTQEISNPDPTRTSRSILTSGALDGAVRAEQSRLLQQKHKGRARTVVALIVLAAVAGAGAKAWRPYVRPYVEPFVQGLFAQGLFAKTAPLPPPPAGPPAAAVEPAPAVAAPAPVAKPASKKRSGRHAKSGASFEEPMRPRGGADDVIPPSE